MNSIGEREPKCVASTHGSDGQGQHPEAEAHTESSGKCFVELPYFKGVEW